jgi:TetR/AcrR family transcriptional repressor of nem operon
MPYAAKHKQETRKRIVRSARRLFNRRGFAEVSIDEILEDAGLTRGGFYKHFDAKEGLYQEAVLEFICAERPEPWQARYVDPNAKGAALARMIVEAYLSPDHFDDRDGSCPMIALPSDVSRGNGAVKAAFRQVLEMMVGAFAANLAPGTRPARERALALAAMVVGGMVLARSVDDKALADDLRESTRRQAFEMSGWDED